MGGREVSTPWGPCYLREKDFPLESAHGFWPLKKALQVNTGALERVLSPQLSKNFRLESALFLDTETTGLAGGTGTYAFLVGLGRFYRGCFSVKQLLMRDYNEEAALLYLLNQELETAAGIVSFNGKTFDLPLLQTRLALSPVGGPHVLDKDHLDLLHPARRLWRHKLASCALNSLEENILGVVRNGDIPGFEIPQRYFQYLRTAQGGLLVDIVEHNTLDLVSLVTLLYRICLAFQASPQSCTCPWEAEALAQIALGRGNPKLAQHYFNAALRTCRNKKQRIRLLWEISLIQKREGCLAAARALWEEILGLEETDLAAYEELAKYYEHRRKDLPRAQEITRRALALARQLQSPKILDLEHRLQRIEGKLQKKGSG